MHLSFFSRPSKLTAGNCAATARRSPVSLLANYQGLFGSVHLINLMNIEKTHQDGRRRTTAHWTFSASTATQESCV